MKTREEQLAAGISKYDIDHKERVQAVYDFAAARVKEHVPDAPGYLQVAMTRELLLAATGAR